MSLANRHILIGVTGGIAAYKAAELARLFVKAGADVRVQDKTYEMAGRGSTATSASERSAHRTPMATARSRAGDSG